jgi:tetratricopeptide (TPR) repeat protein
MDNGDFRFASLPWAVLDLVVNPPVYEPITLTVDRSYPLSEIRLRLRRTNEIGRARSRARKSPRTYCRCQQTRDYDAGRRKLHAEKDAEGSLEEFRKAIVSSPDFYEAYEQMGLAYLQMGKPEDAEKAVRKSIEVSRERGGGHLVFRRKRWRHFRTPDRGNRRHRSVQQLRRQRPYYPASDVNLGGNGVVVGTPLIGFGPETGAVASPVELCSYTQTPFVALIGSLQDV